MSNKNYEPKIGDRIRVVEDHCDARVGMTGTVKHIADRVISVEFDETFDGGHNCYGRTESGRGQFLPVHMIECINKESENLPEYKIVIVGKGDKTSAIYYESGKRCSTAEVNRYYKDVYSVSEAVNAVVDKLLENKQNEDDAEIKVGDLVEVTEDILGSPIPKGARGHVKDRGYDSYLVDFHGCYGETSWDIPECKIRKIDPYETNKK